MTAITKHHWIELIIRSITFLLTLASYIVEKCTNSPLFQYFVYGVILSILFN